VASLPARSHPTCRWLDHCFSLSLRDLELIVAARGIVVSYESIRDWGVSNHFQLCRHHLSANQHRTVRDAAFRTWREVAEFAPVASAITRPPLCNLTTPFLALCCLPLTTAREHLGAKLAQLLVLIAPEKDGAQMMRRISGRQRVCCPFSSAMISACLTFKGSS
jgi:hypothetical protein